MATQYPSSKCTITYYKDLTFLQKAGIDTVAYYDIYTPKSKWKIEIYTHTLMGSVPLHDKEINQTMIKMGGAYVGSPESPGLYARNTYAPFYLYDIN